MNAGIELVKREEFMSDVRQVVSATKSDYYHVLEQELYRAVRLWTQDAIRSCFPAWLRPTRRRKRVRVRRESVKEHPTNQATNCSVIKSTFTCCSFVRKLAEKVKWRYWKSCPRWSTSSDKTRLLTKFQETKILVYNE